MGRDSQFDGRDPEEREQQTGHATRMRLSQGRGGGSDSAQASIPAEFDLDLLRRRVDDAAEGGPTLDQFVDRLEKSGIHAIASVQSNGRWNGISYQYAGVRVKGSDLGRAYTATGLRTRKGVQYDPARDEAQLRSIASEPRTSGPHRDTQYRDAEIPRRPDLDDRQQGVLWEAGRFRAVAVSDLTRAWYQGSHAALDRDLDTLGKLGLIERHTVSLDRRGGTISAVTLTREGRKLVRKSLPRGSAQAIYSGLVKPRELAHDASLYRMYRAEAARIEASGGRVRRVILDYELKKRAYSPLAKAQDLPPFERAQRQQEIARENGLSVVDGRIAFPDVRVEYELPDGELRDIDLELATRNYRAAHIHSKAKAGFKIYVDSASGALSAVLDDHDLIAELLRT